MFHYKCSWLFVILPSLLFEFWGFPFSLILAIVSTHLKSSRQVSKPNEDLRNRRDLGLVELKFDQTKDLIETRKLFELVITLIKTSYTTITKRLKTLFPEGIDATHHQSLNFVLA